MDPMNPAPANPASAGASRSRRIAIAVAAVICLLGLYAWYDARLRIGSTQEELARRLRDIEADSRDARVLAKQAQETARETQAKLALVESKLAEPQSQQLALESMYQELSRSRDEWALAEIEQVLTVAAQQLQLSGNVRATLLALQLAESRLSRADRPQFIPLRKALARDVERLRALPNLDVAGLSLKLDGLVNAVDGMPLAFDERMSESAKPGKVAAKGDAPQPSQSSQGFFARFGTELWDEVKGLVQIRRIDGPEAPLLAPSQAYFVRENLKLRLLNARLALAMRDEAGLREDLRVAQVWVNRYFDARSKQAVAFGTQLRQLAAAPVSFDLPTLSDSLEAVRGFKTRRERGGA